MQVGSDKAKFTDTIWIVVLRTAISGPLKHYSQESSTIIVLFIWLALVKHFFDADWLKASAMAIIAIILSILIAAYSCLLESPL